MRLSFRSGVVAFAALATGEAAIVAGGMPCHFLSSQLILLQGQLPPAKA